MVVAGRNPAGVLSGQRLPCHSPFRHSVVSFWTSNLHHQGLFCLRSVYYIYAVIDCSKCIISISCLL